MKLSVDERLSISLIVSGKSVRTIPLEDNPLVYFPASTTLARNIPIARFPRTSEDDFEGGRYSLVWSPSDRSFILRGRPVLTFTATS